MKTGKKSLSLLLAIIMVVSLLGGAFVVNAADAVTITLEATVGGETVTITATGLGDQFTALDMSTIGLPGLSGINNALWFDHDGTFSFDKDVTLSYQGTQTAELKAGEVANIADGIWSEFALTLDDGNFLTIVDKDNPGNFAYSPANTPLSEFPGTIGEAAAAEEPAEEEPAEEPAEEEPAEEEPAEEPAEEEPAEEEPAEEEPAEEEPAEEEPAAEGEGFVKTDALEVGKQYVFVAEYDGKYYAMTYIGGNFSAIEVEVAGDAVAPAEIGYVWTLENDNKAQSAASAGIFLFPYSGGMTYTDGRSLIYDGSAIYFITSDGTPGYVTFDGASFAYVKGNADAAAKMLIFTGEFSGEAAEPAEEKPSMSIFDYPHPETVRRDAVKNEDGSITLAFTSDTHYDGENFNLKAWLEAAEAEVGYIDAMGFCGDMGSAYDSGPKFWVDVSDVMAYMDEQIAAGKVGDAIYTTGNHEWFPSGGGNYSAVYADTESAQRLQIIGEAMTTEDYVIFCFGAGESAGLPYGGASVNYKYYQDEIDYFAEWLETAPTDIPIFVLTHYPLHAWEGRGEFRSQENAAEIIDILNEHPNLVVLWGHNHSDYDDNYYLPKFPGDEILIDKGVTKTINFTYLAAGCTADTEYTGPSAGSASVMNKGLIVTLNADGTRDYNYVTIDGQFMSIESPWLVRFRGAFGNYEVFNTQSVEDGQTPEAVEAPEVEGYEFAGWYTYSSGKEVEFDFSAPITRNTLVTAMYNKILMPAAAPDEADCVTVIPDATFNGESLTMKAAGVGDLITVFDLSSIGYGSAIMYGFWFEPGGVISFSQNATLLYQGAATDFTLRAGEFYSTEGLGEHYIQLDDGNDLLLLEYENPGNYASYPGTEPYSAYPGTVSARAADAAVCVTVSVAGSVVVPNVPVMVSDLNADGGFDVDEVLTCAHDQLYPGGAAAGYASADGDWGKSIAMLWGDTSGNFGYYVDNAVVLTDLTAPVQAGGSVYAYVYADAETYSDVFTYFDQTDAAVENGTLTLTLMAAAFDENWSPITVPCAGATITIDGAATEFVTDENGQVTVTFEEDGSYLISAVSDEAILVPAICKVTAIKASEPAPGEGGTYVVQEGDTIRSIAKMFYGISAKWTLIYEANYDTMQGPGLIYVGQELLIP